ncbi:MAG: hypothetical protein U0163_08200 [Gemmatimonadaceae bacterium]
MRNVRRVSLGLARGTLDTGTRQAMDAHRVSCLRCAALVRDIEQIQHQAVDLPMLAPSRDLWAGIAARIDDTVVAAPVFGAARPVTRRAPGAPRYVRWAAAAALLIAASSSITYFATTRQLGTTSDTSHVATVSPAGDTGRVTVPSTELPSAATPSATVTPVASSTVRQRVPAVVTYDHEITDLQRILVQRRNDLDPATVAVVEHSLATIDSAINEARAALASDPASRFLSEQLNKALEKKLGLLRTVALLPSRA